MRSINLEQWIEEYKPIFIGEELKDFDLFKDELQQISNYFIWTEISCENEEFYIIPGFHWVNKFRVFVTEIPWENENIEVDDNEHIKIKDAVEAGLEFTQSIGFTLNEASLDHWYFDEFKEETLTTGDAKYHLIDYLENLEIYLTSEQEDKLHDFYSQL